jgi:HTH-type transcriptional regulator / antitoxin HipB
MVVEVNL